MKTTLALTLSLSGKPCLAAGKPQWWTKLTGCLRLFDRSQVSDISAADETQPPPDVKASKPPGVASIQIETDQASWFQVPEIFMRKDADTLKAALGHLISQVMTTLESSSVEPTSQKQIDEYTHLALEHAVQVVNEPSLEPTPLLFIPYKIPGFRQEGQFSLHLKVYQNLYSVSVCLFDFSELQRKTLIQALQNAPSGTHMLPLVRMVSIYPEKDLIFHPFDRFKTLGVFLQKEAGLPGLDFSSLQPKLNRHALLLFFEEKMAASVSLSLLQPLRAFLARQPFSRMQTRADLFVALKQFAEILSHNEKAEVEFLLGQREALQDDHSLHSALFPYYETPQSAPLDGKRLSIAPVVTVDFYFSKEGQVRLRPKRHPIQHFPSISLLLRAEFCDRPLEQLISQCPTQTDLDQVADRIREGLLH